MAIVTLGGCMTCREESYYKPVATDDATKVLHKGILRFDPEPGVVLVARLCDQREAHVGDEFFCIYLELQEGRTVRFVDPKVVLVDGGTEKVAMLTDIRSMVYCRDWSKCPEADISPLAGSQPSGTVKKIDFRGGIQNSFDASLPFTGATLGWRRDGRTYNTISELLPAKPSEFRLRLPAIEVDGRLHQLPTIGYRWTTESVCTIPAP